MCLGEMTLHRRVMCATANNSRAHIVHLVRGAPPRFSQSFLPIFVGICQKEAKVRSASLRSIPIISY